MNAKSLTAIAILAAAAGSAFAESPIVATDDFVSTKSRAEVQADLAAFKKAGVNPWSTTYRLVTGFQSTASRADVIADYVAHRGAVAAITSEDGGSAYAKRAPVQAVGGDTLAGQPLSGQ